MFYCSKIYYFFFLNFSGRPGAKAVYKRFNSNAQETVFLGVEDFALAEYKFTLNFDGKF